MAYIFVPTECPPGGKPSLRKGKPLALGHRNRYKAGPETRESYNIFGAAFPNLRRKPGY